MKQLKETASGVAAPFLTSGTARKSELLFASLHGVKAISHRILYYVAASEIRHCNSLLIHSQKLQKKFRNIVKHLTRTNREIPFLWCKVLVRKTRLKETEPRVAELKFASEGQLLEHKLANTENRITRGRMGCRQSNYMEEI